MINLIENIGKAVNLDPNCYELTELSDLELEWIVGSGFGSWFKKQIKRVGEFIQRAAGVDSWRELAGQVAIRYIASQFSGFQP